MRVSRMVVGIVFLPPRITASGQNALFLDINASWSPDGRWLVFESRRQGNAQLYIIGADGRDERRLTHSLADDTHAAWSPDGSRILFDSDRDGDEEVYVMDADGNNVVRITSSPGRDGTCNLVARRTLPALHLGAEWQLGHLDSRAGQPNGPSDRCTPGRGRRSPLLARWQTHRVLHTARGEWRAVRDEC